MVDDREPGWQRFESKRWIDVPRDGDAPYYCAPGKTPEETYVEIAQRVAGLVERITTELRQKETMPEVGRIRNWHRYLFWSTFPGSAGRFRAEPCRFGVWLPDGPQPADWTFSSRTGTDSDMIRAELTDAVEEFQQSLPKFSQAASPEGAGKASAQLFSEILRIHPFVDGNMRVSGVMLFGAIRQFDYDPSSFFKLNDIEFAAAYSTALRPDAKRSTEPLAELIARRIQKGS